MYVYMYMYIQLYVRVMTLRGGPGNRTPEMLILNSNGCPPAAAMRASSSPTLRLHAVGLLCALVAIAAYYNSLQCGLAFDDDSAIRKNKDLRPELRSWWDLLRHDFWGATLTHPESHKSYRPLTVATFRLNYMLHELQPLGYHLVNVLLHSAVCYLYVLLCGVVFSEVWPALIAGLLFAVHPIHTEAVS